jgi:hypothetical protein
MCFYLRQASPLELARYARNGVDPSDLDGDGGEFDHASEAQLQELQRGLREVEKTGSIVQMTRFVRQMAQRHFSDGSPLLQHMQSKLPGRGRKTGGAPVLDLHKSWHMLHYVLSGSAWTGAMPAATLLAGGRPVGADLGYGPARAVSEQETRDFARFLSGLDVTVLSARLDLDAMHRLGIYCAEDNDPGVLADLEEDLECFFPELQDFVSDAAGKRLGMLVWMS